MRVSERAAGDYSALTGSTTKNHADRLSFIRH
jgi:hypothetical protein